VLATVLDVYILIGLILCYVHVYGFEKVMVSWLIGFWLLVERVLLVVTW